MNGIHKMAGQYLIYERRSLNEAHLLNEWGPANIATLGHF
jgi:hypothetical protein